MLAILALAASLHVVACEAVCASVDLTIVPGTNGSAVVDACITKISDVFADDQQMLRRVAYVETRYGNNPDTYSNASNDGGIWQLSRSKYDATKNTSDTSLNLLIQDI